MKLIMDALFYRLKGKVEKVPSFEADRAKALTAL
jgi:hypothetical protein